MAKYCVAYVNFFDNVLNQHIVESSSDVNACVDFIKDQAARTDYPLDKSEEERMRSFTSAEELQGYTFQHDYLVSAIKI